MPPPKTRSRENSNTSQPPAVFKKPPHGSSSHGNGDVSQRGEGSKPRQPMLPRLGGPSKGSASPSQQSKPPTGYSSKLGSPTRNGGIKGHSVDKSSEGAGAGGGGIASRIQKFQKKSPSEDWHGATTSSSSGGNVGDERTRSGSAGSQTSLSPNHSKQGSPNRAVKKPLIPVKLLSSDREKEREREREKERRGKEGTSNDRQTRGSISAMMKERVSPRVPPPHSPHNPHTHTSHIHEESQYASLSVLTNHSIDVTDEVGGEYENVDIQPMSDQTGGRGHQPAPPHQPTAYENVPLKPSPKAQHGHAQQKSRPHQQQSSTSRQQSLASKLVHQSSSMDSYENIEFSPLPSQSSQRHGPAPSMPAPVLPSEEHVMDDDDTLFGKEGPPGMKREEVIYENFGPDDGNKYMTVEEMERHIRKKDKKGLSAEYLRIKTNLYAETTRLAGQSCDLYVMSCKCLGYKF